jgi:hypothetical protein
MIFMVMGNRPGLDYSPIGKDVSTEAEYNVGSSYQATAGKPQTEKT